MSDIHDTIAQIDALEAKATPGPWRTYSCSTAGDVYGGEEDNRIFTHPGVTDPRNTCKDDAALIVALRNAAPSLIAYIRALERVRDAANDVVNIYDMLARCSYEQKHVVLKKLDVAVYQQSESLAAAREAGK